MKKVIKKIKFSHVLLVTVVFLLGVALLNALFRYTPQGQQQVRPGEQIVIPGVRQYSSFVKIEPDASVVNPNVTQKVLLVVYVEDFASLNSSQINLLITRAREAAGLTEANSRVVLREYTDVDLPEDYADDTNPETAIDPTNPASYRMYGNTEANEQLRFSAGEPIEGISFAEYVQQVKPATDDYEIYLISGTSYLVVLKQAYSQIEFEQDVLVNFPDRGNYQFSYQDREQSKLANP